MSDARSEELMQMNGLRARRGEPRPGRERDSNARTGARSIVVVGPDPSTALLEGGHVTDVVVLRQQLRALGFEPAVVPESPGDRTAATRLQKLQRAMRRARACKVECRRSDPCFVVLLAGPPLSFLEKALIAGLLRLSGWRTLLCPRSGRLAPAANASYVWRKLLATAARLPDAVVVQSRTWQEFFTEFLRVESHRVHVVSNWVATAELPTRSRSAGSPETRLVFAAPFTKDKGIDDVVNMLPALVPVLRSRGATFTLIGDGPAREAVRRVVAGGAPSVRSHPAMPRSEFLALLAEQDVLVVPSRIEGMPNLIAEAMCMGLVVVATSVGGISDVISSGHNGYLYEPGDLEHLTAIMNELLSRQDLLDRLSAAARETGLERFSAERNVRRLADLGCRQSPVARGRADGNHGVAG